MIVVSISTALLTASISHGGQTKYPHQRIVRKKFRALDFKKTPKIEMNAAVTFNSVAHFTGNPKVLELRYVKNLLPEGPEILAGNHVLHSPTERRLLGHQPDPVNGEDCANHPVQHEGNDETLLDTRPISNNVDLDLKSRFISFPSIEEAARAKFHLEESQDKLELLSALGGYSLKKYKVEVSSLQYFWYLSRERGPEVKSYNISTVKTIEIDAIQSHRVLVRNRRTGAEYGFSGSLDILNAAFSDADQQVDDILSCYQS